MLLCQVDDQYLTGVPLLGLAKSIHHLNFLTPVTILYKMTYEAKRKMIYV